MCKPNDYLTPQPPLLKSKLPISGEEEGRATSPSSEKSHKRGGQEGTPGVRQRHAFTLLTLLLILGLLSPFANAPRAAAQSANPGGVSTNLAWWYQGDAGVQTSGTAVTGWNDMLGALNVTQATAGSRPSYTRYQNFNPVVTFDGTNDFLRNTAGYWKGTTANQQYNLFAVSTSQSTSANTLFGENTSGGIQMFWAPNGGNVYSGLYPSYSSAFAWGGTVGTPNVWTGRFNNSSTPKVNAISRDGKQLGSSTTTIAFNGANAPLYLGIYDGASYPFHGDIAEIVMYDRDLSAAERNRVESYLALKWGVTLTSTQPVSYTDSTGAAIWLGTSNSTYHHDVAGIGRDDTSGLNQKQSRSVKSDTNGVLNIKEDDLVTIGLGAIAGTNISNTNSFAADRSFLIWGNNDGDPRFLHPYTSTNTLNTRLDRVWKVSNIGNVSNVEFCVPATTQATHLLVHASDPTFVAAGTVETALTAKTVAGQASLCASSLTFNHGVYFTVARFVQAPVGIVSNIAWWFRGDVGVQRTGTAVTGWNDSAIGWADGTDLPSVTQATATNQPSYTRYQNFNPVVTFDGTNDFLRNTAGYWKGTTNNQQYNLFAVSTSQSTSANTLFGENTSGGIQMFWAPNGGNAYSGLYPSYTSAFAWGGTVGTPNLWTGRFNNSSTTKVNAISRDGKQLGSNTTTIAFNGANAPLYLGIYDGVNYPFHGDIAEILMYDRDLSLAERQRIESYLALKWGVTLDQSTPTNYVASDGSVIWNATANAGYKYDIAGIGKDTLAELNQKQSRSIKSDDNVALGIKEDDLVTIGLGAIAGTNISNTNTFAADRSFLIWGNNDGAPRFLQPYTSTNTLNTRLDRVWKVSNIGNVSNVEFCVPATTQATHLLVHASDPTFVAAGTTETALTAKTVAGQASLCASSLTFNHGVYFTVARFVQAPVGIVSNIAWWFRGDVGVQRTGTAVTGWNDSAIGWADGTDLPSVTQATATNQPSYTRYQNFNPVVTFDGANDFLRNTAGYWKGTTANQQYNLFAVSTSQSTSANTLFGENTSGGIQMFWAPNGGNAYSGLYNTYASAFAWGGTVGTPNLWTGRFNNSSTTKVNAISRDGKQLGSSTTTIAFNGANAPLYLGIYDGASYPFHGDIAEIVMYDRDLSLAERQRIESYLALKWGLTLDQSTPTNYVASDGSVIWNATANAGYKYDIAGIGKDTLAELNQKQSRSVKSDDNVALGIKEDDLVTIGLGAIAGTNISNTNSFAADRSFLIWGNNDGDPRFMHPYSGSGVVNTRLDRVWKVSNVGNVSNVEFCVLATTQATRLLVHATDPAFGAGTTETALVAKTVAGQASLCASNLTFNDGAYFTVARYNQAPGHVVTNLGWWFRGDMGVQRTGTAVTGWNDSAIGWADGTDLPSVTQATATNQPSYTRYQNFNPVVTFDGSNDFLRNTAGYWRGTTANQQYNLFAVSTAQSTSANTLFGENTSAGVQMVWVPNGANAYSGLYNTYVSAFAWGGTAGTPDLWTGRFNNSSTPKVNAISRDGKQLGSNTTTIAFNGANAPLYLGIYDGANYPFHGDIAEILMYDRDLSAAERNRVESYLALKWGFTLAGTQPISYTDSTGAVIWNAVIQSAYHNDVAGIGRDDSSGLNQKQSASIDSDNLVTLGLGTIASTNISNTNSFAADRSFLIWGNNNGATSFDTPIPTTELRYMTRLWKVVEIGTVGSVKIRVPDYVFIGAQPTLVRSADTTFTTADTLIPLADDGNGNLEAVLDLANGDYFTLAQEPPPAPGAVVNNLAWWFRGDWGVQSSGTAVTQWGDGTGAVPVSQATTSNRPSFTKAQNFNPVVTFDGSNDYLRNTAGYWKNTTNNQQYNTFVVSTNRNVGGVNAAFGENTNVQPQIMFLPYGGNAYNGLWSSYLGNAAWGGTVGTPYLWSGRFNNSSTPKLNAILRDGKQLGSSAATVAFNGANSALDIGASAANSWYYNGDLAEVIMYARDLSATERQRVQSYLAIKWGISLDQSTPTDYLASSGAVLWNATADSAYTYRVAGIGADKYTGLDQRISRSAAPGGIVTLATTEDFTSRNQDSSRTALSDNSYLLWGDNNLDATAWVTNSVASGYPSGKARLTREWLVRSTGTIPPVNLAVQVDDTAANLPEVMGVLYLIVDQDKDGSFSDEATQRMTARGAGLYTIANVTLSNGMKFTFGTAGGGVRGAVFQDNDTDGQRDANEPGLADITVTAVDASGTLTTTVTDAEGKFVFLNAGLEGNTRITFDLPVSALAAGPLDYLTDTVLGSNSRTTEQFVYVGDGWTVTSVGFTPKDRPSPCTNPTVATVCYENGAGSSQAGWLSFPFNSGPTQYRSEASTQQMGAVWGSAYDINSGRLYSGALLKRHVALGPLAGYNGTDTYTVDGVYAVQYNNGVGSFNATNPGFKLQGVNGIDLGTVQRHPDTNSRLDNNFELMANSTSIDTGAFNKAGMVGFGNADFTGNALWLVNLNQRALIQVNTAGLPINGSTAPAGNVTQYPITNPGCSNGDFRPWALTFNNGLGYLGVVCSAETSRARADLHAYILSFNPANVAAGFTSVLNFRLDFLRESAQTTGVFGGVPFVAGWQPWARSVADVTATAGAQPAFSDKTSYPQPILADIDFTATGDMIIGFMDRWGLQTTVTDPRPDNGARYTAVTAGDMIHACAVGSNAWVVEGAPGCTGYLEAAGLNKLLTDGPFTVGEYFDDDTHMYCHGGYLTYEDLTGSVCVVGNTILATNFGQFSEGSDLYSAGIRRFDVTTGRALGTYIIPDALPCTGGTASLNNALGELSCICPSLPVEIGNRIWTDYNRNGVQDPGEPPIAGLLVELVNSSGTVIGTAITDGRGEYYFSSAPGTSTSNIKYGLSIPGAGVTVRIPNVTGGTRQGPLANLILSPADQGGDDGLDSDATLGGSHAVIPVDTSGGRIDHTYDFGFAPEAWDIALRKTAPLQYAAPDSSITFALEIFNQVGGPMNNIVLIDYVPTGLRVSDSNWTPGTLSGPGTVQRTLNAGDELPAGGLLPGQSVVVNVTMQISGTLANNTVLTNKAEVVSFTDSSGTPLTDVDSTPDNVDNDPLVDDMIDNTGGDEDDHDVAVVTVTSQTDVYDLALRKITPATVVSEGDDVLFTIEIFNQGTSTANGIQLVDRYPAGFTLSPNETGWADQGNGTALRTLTTLLPPGGSSNVSILLRAGSTLGALQNYAEIKQDNGNDVDSQPEDDENDGNGDKLQDNIISNNGTDDEDDHDIATVTVRRFDLALRKTLAAGEANPTARGADATFVIEVFNQGSVNAYDITLVDYLTNTLTLSANDANGWLPGDVNQVINSIPGPLAPGTSARISITLRVSDTAAFGALNNYAEIAQASDIPAGPPTDDADSSTDYGNGNDTLVDNVIDNSNNDEDDHDVASVTIGHFDLALTKIYKGDEGLRGSGSNKTDGIIGVGERVTFTLSVFNQGDVTAYNIEVTDNSPRGLIIDDSNMEYNIFKGWAVENDQRGHYVFPGPLAPGQSASIDVIIFVVGPQSPFYPPAGLVGTHTTWGEISSATYKPGGLPIGDDDSIPDPDETNDGAVKDNVTNEQWKVNPATNDQDDHDPAQITVIPNFDLALIKYPQTAAIGGDKLPLVEPGDVITYEYLIVNQGVQTAQDITLVEYVPTGLILNDANWTPSMVVGPGTATRTHSGINLVSNALYTNTVRFQINPAMAVNTIYTNAMEIANMTGPANNPNVIDIDSVPDTDNNNEGVIKDDLLTDNFLSDPTLFDDDDHDIAAVQAVVEDWGDNPDSGVGRATGNYGTLVADNGPRHGVIPTLVLGTLLDGEADGQPTATANGDDANTSDDEDGVTLADLYFVENDPESVRVRATNQTGSPAYLYGFVDFNANGDFTEAGEAISVTVPTGSNNVVFNLNFGATPANGLTSSFARFRLSTETGLTAQGPALDGEVEDYPVTISTTPAPPASSVMVSKELNTVEPLAPGGALSFTLVITNTGDAVITVLPLEDRYQTTFLNYVSANPAPTNPANGVVSWSNLAPAGGLAPGASVQVVVNFTARADTTLLVPVLPCNQQGESSNIAQVRNALTASGPVAEDADDTACDSVEILSPTAVTLVERSVVWAENQATVQWRTENEVQVISFNLLRVDLQGNVAKINEQTILAQRSGQSEGAAYSQVDSTIQPGQYYRYVLEVTDVNGAISYNKIGEIATGGGIYLPVIGR